ncbi:MAG: nucleotide exchange factor GrpE [Acidobacteriota bacterium]
MNQDSSPTIEGTEDINQQLAPETSLDQNSEDSPNLSDEPEQAVGNMSEEASDASACGQDEGAAAQKAEVPGPASISADQYAQLQGERDELYDRLLRKQAEFENFRKRTDKEKQEFYDFALLGFVRELLPILDGLERSLYAPDGESVESHKKGIELVLKQFRETLSQSGLQPIRAMGKIFDPNYHQAVLREECTGLAENEVIEELQRGYTFRERLLRPSMVKVAVPPPTSSADMPTVPTEPNGDQNESTE